MTTVTCDKCNGTGMIRAEESKRCGATLQVGDEIVECWADRYHVGYPHACMLVSPCYACGGFDEHTRDCGVYEMRLHMENEDQWWMWSSGDLVPRRVENRDDWMAWKAIFMDRQQILREAV
jgi:hypothetical protein